MKVSATPQSKLAKEIEQGLREFKWKDLGTTMVVECSGQNVTNRLYKSNPFKSKGCLHKVKCPVNNNQDCRQMALTYQVTCKLCKDIGENEVTTKRGRYIGCTGRTGHKRGSEHMEAATKMTQSYAIGKHYKQHHQLVAKSTQDPIEMKIISVHKTVLEKLIDEGIRLEKAPHLANSKSEWGRGGGLIRLTATSTNTQNTARSTQETQQVDINIQPAQFDGNAEESNHTQADNYVFETINQPTTQEDEEHQAISMAEIDPGPSLQATINRRNPRRNIGQIVRQYQEIVNK